MSAQTTATVLAAIFGAVSGAIFGTLGSLFVLLYGRSLRYRGEIKGKVTLHPFGMGDNPRTLYLDLFNEKDVGVALREFALVFMPPGFLSGKGRAIYSYPREHATGKIIEPVVLAPQEAMRKAMVITADDARQGGPDGSPLPYGQKRFLRLSARAKKRGSIIGISPTSSTIGRCMRHGQARPSDVCQTPSDESLVKASHHSLRRNFMQPTISRV